MTILHSRHIYIQLFVMMSLGVASVLQTLWGATGVLIAVAIGSPLIGISLFFGRRYSFDQRPANKQIANVIVVMALLLCLAIFATAGPLPAMLVFLMLVQLAQNFILGSAREVYFSIVIVLMLILYSASESTSGFFLFYLAGFAIACTFVLVSVHSERIARAASQSDKVKAFNSATFPASITVLGLSILAVTTLVYLAMPQLPAGQIGSPFGVLDYYYEDAGWEQEADQQDQPENSEPESSVNDKGSGSLEEAGEPERRSGSGDEQPASSANMGNDRFFREPSGGGAGGPGVNADSVESGEIGESENPGDESRSDAGDDLGEGQPGGAGASSASDQFHYPGFSSQMDIEAPRGAALSNALILHVQSDEEVYLRSHVFDRFDGQSWYETIDNSRKYRTDAGRVDFTQVYDQKRYLRQHVIYEKVLNARILAANFPVRLQFPASVVAAAHDGVMSSPGTIQPGTRYTVFSESGWLGSHPVSRNESLSHWQEYLQLPEKLDPRIADLVAELVAGQEAVQSAIALENYLRENFEYTLDTAISSQNRTPLGEFLFTSKRGHCEYFASAMAIMLRQNEIPSRVVTGFSATNKNPLTGYFEVRGLDAHAWVEAYFPEHGWVTFEPTPAYFLPKPMEIKPTVEALKEYMENLQEAEQLLRESETVADVQPVTLERIMAALRDSLLYLFNLISLILLQAWQLLKVPLLILAVLGVMGTAFLYFFKIPIQNVFSRVRVKHRPVGDPGWFVRWTYSELQGVLARKGYPRAKSATVEEYQEQVKREAFAAPLSALSDLYSQVDYGAYPAAKDDALRARDYYLQIYRSL